MKGKIRLDKAVVERLLGRKGFLTAKEFYVFWFKFMLDIKKARVSVH